MDSLVHETGSCRCGSDVVNPSKTKVISESRIKHDKVDARTLADLLRAGLIAPCYVPPPEVRALRAIVRYRIKLVQNISSRRRTPKS